jgi:hypothetical protein
MAHVIDDFVPQSYQDMAYKHILEDMSWKYLESVSGVEDYGAALPDGFFLSPDQDTFYRDIIHPIEGTTDDFAAGILLPMAYAAQEHLAFDSTIERIRIAMYHRSSGGIHRPHVDYFYPHHTMIYYLNDSDGDTLVYDQHVYDMDRTYPSSFTLKDRVSPKKGRALFIDGLDYHSSSPPVDHRMRIAINFNFVPVGGGERDNQWSIKGLEGY